jgi:hypothetical protein
VKEHIRTEEQQKDLIYKIFSEWQESMCSDRTQTYFLQLCEQIYKWYRSYRSNEVDDMGPEIADVIDNFMNRDKKLNIPKDKDGFLKYLNTSLKNKRRIYLRKFDENDIIRIPKKTIKDVEKFIEKKESDAGRTLTTDQRIKIVSEWYNISERKTIEYLKLINKKSVSRLDSFNNDCEEKNILDSKELKPPYLSNFYEKPESAFFTNFKMANIREAVNSLLDKKREKTRDCYRALFTLYCIRNCKDFEKLYPVLDKSILEAWQKDGKEPNQHEIYQKYHPKVGKKSAEVMASTNLGEFLNDIETYLKPIIFP